MGRVVLGVLALSGFALIGVVAAARAPQPAHVASVDGAVSTAPASAPPALLDGGAPASLPPPSPSAVPPDDATATLPDGRIVLNLAGEDELVKLPGIGPARARAILDLRRRLVRFRAFEDLLRVRGIGRKTLARIKPKVVLDRPP